MSHLWILQPNHNYTLTVITLYIYTFTVIVLHSYLTEYKAMQDTKPLDVEPNSLKQNSSPTKSSTKEVNPINDKPSSPNLLNFSEYTRHYPTSQMSSTPCKPKQKKEMESYKEETVEAIAEVLTQQGIEPVSSDCLKLQEIQELEAVVAKWLETAANRNLEEVSEVEFDKLEQAHNAIVNEYQSKVDAANQEIEYLLAVSIRIDIFLLNYCVLT